MRITEAHKVIKNALYHLNDQDRPLGMFDAHKDAERILGRAHACVGTELSVYIRQQENCRLVAYRATAAL